MWENVGASRLHKKEIKTQHTGVSMYYCNQKFTGCKCAEKNLFQHSYIVQSPEKCQGYEGACMPIGW